MAEQNKDNWWGWLVLVILLAIIGLSAYCLVTGKAIGPVEVVVTALILKLGTLMDYRYGSSKGSQEKTAMLGRGQANGTVNGANATEAEK